MKRVSDLRSLFVVVAAVEAVYAATAILTPPGQIEAVTGWVLSADGKWLVKLLGVALASQAWIAWTLRRQPHLGVARALALYQLGSATADWAMWIVLADQGVFSTTLGQVLVIISIPSHYAIGLLLVMAIRRASVAETQASVLKLMAGVSVDVEGLVRESHAGGPAGKLAERLDEPGGHARIGREGI